MKKTLNVASKSIAIGFAASNLTYAAVQDGGKSTSLLDWMPLILLTTGIYVWHRYKRHKDSKQSVQLKPHEIGSSSEAGLSPPKSRKQFIVIGLGIIAVLFLIGLRNNGEKTPNAPTQVNNEFHSTFEEAPFDLNATKLHPEYLGHFCEKIGRTLNEVESKNKKDEFESTEAYLQRIAKQAPIALGPKLSETDALAFMSLPVDTTSTYDADSQKLVVSDSWEYSDEYRMSRNSYIYSSQTKIINRFSSGSESYVGQNGYGATTSINKEKFDVCGLKPPQHIGVTKFEVIVQPEQAKQHKDNLRVLYIGKIAGPRPYFFHEKPTMASPNDLEELGTILRFDLMQAWLIDWKTGDVLTKRVLEPASAKEGKHDGKK